MVVVTTVSVTTFVVVTVPDELELVVDVELLLELLLVSGKRESVVTALVNGAL